MIAVFVSYNVVPSNEIGLLTDLPLDKQHSYCEDDETVTDLLGRYLREIRGYPLLTEGEERSLIVRIAQGDEQARACLIESNLRLVVNIAKRYQSQHQGRTPLLDLIGSGNVGLLRAVDAYDPTYGVRFTTYATFWIKAALLRALDEQSRTIRLSSYRVAQVRHLLTLEDTLIHQLERTPSHRELAAHAGMPLQTVEHVRTADQPPLSLDALSGSGDGDDLCLYETLADQEALDPAQIVCAQEQEREMSDTVQTLLACLTPREREVVTCKFGLDGNGERTTTDICQELGMCSSRVYQLFHSALDKLRRMASVQGITCQWFERCA